MNKIILALALALSLASCKKEEPFEYDNSIFANTIWTRGNIYVKFTDTHIEWDYELGGRGYDLYYVVGKTIYIGQDRSTSFGYRIDGQRTLYWWIDPKTGVNRYILSKK